MSQPLQSKQFSLMSLLKWVTISCLCLPLLPFLLPLGLWYIFSPEGAAADFVLWIADRINPERDKKRADQKESI
jgi:hypothetical protein